MSAIDPGVRIPVDLHDVLRRMAAKNRRSFNAEVVYALESYVQPFVDYEQRRDSMVQQLAASGPSARLVGPGPITFISGPLDGHQYHLEVAPDVYGCPVPNSQRVAYYRLDVPTSTYSFIGER